MRRGLACRIGVACAATLLASACTSRIDSVGPSFETLQVLRERAIPPLAVGTFVPGSDEIGRNISIRLSVLRPPHGSNFADFLQSTFAEELKAAGKFDPASALRIDGRLTESHAGEDLSKGNAALAAVLTLSRSGAPIFSKTFRVETTWKSDFIGAIAIQEAFRQYNSLYALLVRQALSDPEFLAAAKT